MSESQPIEKPKVTVNFKKSADYRIYSATDLWGGQTADGAAVFFHLAIDHFPTPSYQTYIPDKNGRVNLSQPSETIAAGDVEKELLCGILFTPEVAIKIGKWLIDRGNESMKQRGQ